MTYLVIVTAAAVLHLEMQSWDACRSAADALYDRGQEAVCVKRDNGSVYFPGERLRVR